MKTNLISIIALFGISSIYAATQHPVRQEIVEEIRKLTTEWTPKEVHHNPLKDIPADKLQKRLGSLGSSSSSYNNPFTELLKLMPSRDPLRSVRQSVQVGSTSLPANFDPRVQWPSCITPVRNQGECGSCWAFSSAGFLSDRFCIQSSGDIKVVLSPQDMVSCDFENYGCEGGFLVNSVDFLEAEGIVAETCQPYQDKDMYCTFQCQSSSQTYSKYYCTPGSMKFLTSASDIQQELYTNGPMMVGLSVYEDFYSYSSGVYNHVTGSYQGGHAMELVGWGTSTTDGSLYWILKNQWTTAWGDAGYINVKAGTIGIDAMAVACNPDMQ